jgi:hypothetical protein
MKNFTRYSVLAVSIMGACSIAYADSEVQRTVEDRLGEEFLEILEDYDDAALSNIAINDAVLNASVTIDAGNLSLDAVGGFDFEGVGEIAINRISTTGLGVANTGGIALAMASYSEQKSTSFASTDSKAKSSDWSFSNVDLETSSDFESENEVETEISSDSWSVAEMNSSSEIEYELEIDDDVLNNSSDSESSSSSFDVAINADGMFGLGEQANGSLSAANAETESSSNFKSDYDLEEEFEQEQDAFAMAKSTTNYDLDFESEVEVEFSSSSDFESTDKSLATNFSTDATVDRSYDYSNVSTEIEVAAMNVAYNTGRINAGIDLDVAENILAQNIDFSTSATGAVLTGDISIGFDPNSVASSVTAQ